MSYGTRTRCCYVITGDLPSNGSNTLNISSVSPLQVRSSLTSALDDYNATTSKPLSLVLMDYAVEHVMRIAR